MSLSIEDFGSLEEFEYVESDSDFLNMEADSLDSIGFVEEEASLSSTILMQDLLRSNRNGFAETDGTATLSVEGAFSNRVDGSLVDSSQAPSDISINKVSLPNIINVSIKVDGEYTEVYFTNFGVDTIDSVAATYQLNRYNQDGKWISVKTVTMSTTKLKPGKKLIKRFLNTQKYGYEQQVLSFIATDGKDVTSNSASNTRIKNPYSWRDIKTLADHTFRHRNDFGLSYDEFEYSKKANSHYKNRKNSGYEYFVGSDNNIRVYHASSNTFGSYDSNGKSRTYFKPSTRISYWEGQKNKYK